jgi:hypothetical protein
MDAALRSGNCGFASQSSAAPERLGRGFASQNLKRFDDCSEIAIALNLICTQPDLRR